MAQTLEQTREYRRKTPRFNLYSTLRLAKKRAEVTIDVEYLLNLFEEQKGFCALSGIKMTWATGKTEPTSISIDRIDNSKGYIPGNVRLICVVVNAFKSTQTDDELYEFAKTLVENMAKTKPN
jgi:hypothetical protein